MNIYSANKGDSKPIVGSLLSIANTIRVSRQAVHKAYKNNKDCKGYNISFLLSTTYKKLSQREKLSEAVNLLKRSRIIIDEHNEQLAESGEYSNIGIIEDIDRFLSAGKTETLSM